MVQTHALDDLLEGLKRARVLADWRFLSRPDEESGFAASRVNELARAAGSPRNVVEWEETRPDESTRFLAVVIHAPPGEALPPARGSIRFGPGNTLDFSPDAQEDFRAQLDLWIEWATQLRARTPASIEPRRDGMIDRPDFHLTTDIRATSDPLWQNLAKFRRLLMAGDYRTTWQLHDLLTDIRLGAHPAGLRPVLGSVEHIAATLTEACEGDPLGKWESEPKGAGKVILTAFGEGGWIQLLDLDEGLPDRREREIAIEWAESWMNARERQLCNGAMQSLDQNGSNGPDKRNLHGDVTVVLWEGAEHTPRNIRLARTRTAYLEAHGRVADALAALKAAGDEVSRSTFYNHLNALDNAIPQWRDSVLLSNTTGNPDGLHIARRRGKSRDNVG